MGRSTRWLLGLIGIKKSSKKPAAIEEQDVKRSGSGKDKRRWSFGKSVSYPVDAFGVKSSSSSTREAPDQANQSEQARHAIAIAAASAAAAEAAVAAAQAAAAVVRLTGGGNLGHPVFELISREEWAAIKIQTAFRGYLARRALRALKAVVRIQALFRGHRVRKQAAITLRCMQALVRVQARVRARRVRMSKEGQEIQQQLLERRLQGRSRKSMDGWNASTGTVEDFHAKNERKQLGAMKRERALAYALSQSHQLTKWFAELQRTVSPMVIDCEPDTPHWGWSWLERWMAARPWENPLEAVSPVDSSRTKIVEVDTNLSHQAPPTTKHHSPNKINTFNSRGSTAPPPPPAFDPPPPPPPPPPPLASAKPVKKRSGSASDAIAPDHAHNVLPSNALPANVLPLNVTASQPVTDHRQAANSASHPSPVDHREFSPTPAAAKDHLALGDWSGKNSLKPLKNSSALDGLQQDLQQTIRELDLGLSSEYGQQQAAVPSYMATTQSSKAKVRSHSTPKQRPELLGLMMPDTPRKNMRNSINGGLLVAGTLESRSVSSSAGGMLMKRSGGAAGSGNSRGFSGSVALDRSMISLKDMSMNGDMRKPFRF